MHKLSVNNSCDENKSILQLPKFCTKKKKRFYISCPSWTVMTGYSYQSMSALIKYIPNSHPLSQKTCMTNNIAKMT